MLQINYVATIVLFVHLTDGKFNLCLLSLMIDFGRYEAPKKKNNDSMSKKTRQKKHDKKKQRQHVEKKTRQKKTNTQKTTEKKTNTHKNNTTGKKNKVIFVYVRNELK